ncbi:lipoyl synthase [Desulforhopalus sp. 52FAK]
MSQCNNKIRVGKPKWLRRTLPTGPEYEKIRNLLNNHSLTTVCQEAKCPNQFECYGEGTATFMILGEKCTRNCRFCAVGHPPESLPDPEEPERVAEAVALLELRYAVVTSVTRDDLADGGAALFAETIKAIKKARPETLVEVLIPDLQGNWEALETILQAGPDVLNHNVETISRLYPEVRPQAIYGRSLELLQKVKELQPQLVTKSGLMVGLGETLDELSVTWRDILRSGTDILTIGQYLQPSAAHLEVQRFIPPEEFEEYAKMALEDGFAGVASGAFVRSSYQAEKLYRKAVRALERKNI